MSQLQLYRDMTERHVQAALKTITASADPSDYIDESFIEEFLAAAVDSWIDGYAVVTDLLGDPFIPLASSVVNDAIQSSASTYRSLLADLISNAAFPAKRDPIYGEFLRGNLVQYGDVRPLLVALGGGPADPTIELSGGVTSGPIMSDFLRQNGVATDQKIWLYGYEDEPRRTFNGHLQMDGLVFSDWDDDGLRIAPQDAWLRATHYRPGDHWGCACVVAPFIPNFGPDFTIQLTDGSDDQ